jgi:hypothetical protein
LSVLAAEELEAFEEAFDPDLIRAALRPGRPQKGVLEVRAKLAGVIARELSRPYGAPGTVFARHLNCNERTVRRLAEAHRAKRRGAG